MCYSKKRINFEFALGRSYDSEAVLLDERVPGEDFKTSEALVSDVKRGVVKSKKVSNENAKKKRNR